MPSVMIATMTDPGLSSAASAAISAAVSVMSLPIKSSSAVLLRWFSFSGHHGELVPMCCGRRLEALLPCARRDRGPRSIWPRSRKVRDWRGGTGSLIAWPDR